LELTSQRLLEIRIPKEIPWWLDSYFTKEPNREIGKCEKERTKEIVSYGLNTFQPIRISKGYRQGISHPRGAEKSAMTDIMVSPRKVTNDLSDCV
jgi:hypothetical protein